MEKNYYHIRMKAGDNFRIETPAGGHVDLIAGAAVTRQLFPTGDEMTQIFHDGRIDIYASFPIEAKPR